MRTEERLRAVRGLYRTDMRVVRGRVVLYVATLLVGAVGFAALRGASGWGDPASHAVLEAVATVLALFLGVLALVRFYSKKNNVFLFLGTGFLATAALDGFHALRAAGYPATPAGDAVALEAWSWFASRAMLGLFFCLNWLGWRRERRMGPAGRVGEGIVYVTTGLLTAGTVMALAATPLPGAVDPAATVARPQELLAAVLFLLALVGYLAKGHWRDNAFDHWLVLSLVVGFLGEGLFMPFSTVPYDAMHAAGHGAKLASYGCVMVGLLVSVYSTFRQAEDSAVALAHEVVERERAQAELEIQKTYLEKLFESAPEAIVVLDEERRIRRMNDEFTRMFGYDRRAALGRRIEELVVPEERRDEARGWHDRVARGHTVGYETIRRRQDGSVVDVSVLGTAIALEPDRTAIYEIYRDITARKRAEEELHRAKEEAEEATRAKSEFLAHMSHELRTPLNSVIGFANVLLKGADGELDPRETTYLQRIRENGLLLLALINDILDLSKIEAGKMEVKLEDVALSALVAETLAQFRGQVMGRDLELEADIPDDLIPLEADPGKLKQILINLVGNAVKFTETGRVTVRVGADPASRRATWIEVEDTGIGIPPDRLRAIFDAFEQGDSGTARGYGGTGLGLTISALLCRLLGYRLEVESEIGRGSTFRVVLSPRGTAGPDLASQEGDQPAADTAVSA